jgi:hypothetical protein
MGTWKREIITAWKRKGKARIYGEGGGKEEG